MRLLERRGDIAVIGEAGDAATAHSLFRSLDPQIVVMDISMPGTSGIEAMRRMLLYKPDARVLMFSMHEDVIFVRRAFQAGAFGYVTKASAPNVLIAQALALSDFGGERDAADGLSARELEVLRLLAQGQSIRDIAESLGLNPKTVANQPVHHQTKTRCGIGHPTSEKEEHTWSAYAHYSYIDATFRSPLVLNSPSHPFQDDDGNIQVVPGDHLPLIPTNRFKLGGDFWLLPNWSVGASVNIVSASYYKGDESNRLPELPDYHLFSLRTTGVNAPGVPVADSNDPSVDTRF